MIIDSHVHIWKQDPRKYPWQPVGDYIPSTEAPASSLLEVMDATGVDRAVLVQPTPYGWDNSYLLDACSSHPSRFAAVCLVDPHSSQAVEDLKRLVLEQGVRGLRINWNLEPYQVWQQDANHRKLWECLGSLGVPVCLQLTPDHLELAGAMASDYPEVSIVLDHLGRPPAGCDPTEGRFQRFLQLAANQNCHTKLSGLYYFSAKQAPYEDAWPLLQAAIHAYGPRRCMWGSDFPFVVEHWSYQDALFTIQHQLEIRDEDRAWILGETAASLWWSE